MNNTNLSGLFVATATPFTPEGCINDEVLAKLIERHIREGASGMYVGGSSAECFLLTEHERMHIFNVAGAYAHQTNIIAHVGAIATDEAIRYAKAAKDSGCAYISATPPFYYGFNNKQIAQYFYDIASGADMPVLLYNFPGNTGKLFNLNDPVIQALFRSKAIFGIKHTDYNLYALERIKNLNPDLVILNGYDETMAASYNFGAVGAVGSTFNVMLPHYLKLFSACKDNDLPKMQDLQRRANNIMEAFVSKGLIASIKFILKQQGYDAGESRRPFTPLTNEDGHDLWDVFQKNIAGLM